MKPIRVLNLFTIMNRGGAESMVMNYYRNMDRTKIQFDFMVHRQEKGAFDDEIEALGGRIFHALPVYPQNYFKYKKFIREFLNSHHEYKIIHSHMSELGYWFFKEAAKQKVPVRICHAHNAPDFSKLKITERVKSVVRNYFKAKIKPLSTHFFVCSTEAGNWLFGKEMADEFTMMKNAIDARKYSFNPKTRLLYRNNLSLNNKFVIAHVGRFNEQKNHSFLIDVFGEIVKKKPESCLLLIGGGSLEKAIKSKVKTLGLMENVRFLGIRDDIEMLLNAADVFLFPSLFEGLPVTLIEAQASGMKCVISDTISKQVIITNNVIRISLSKSTQEWSDIALMQIDYNRENTYAEIKNAGFDIVSNAKWLTDNYLNSIKIQ